MGSRINAAIESGEQEDFAVVVCDINDLKKVNDLYGHKEGDACIMEACKKICAVFAHSPVFRVGGDEFVVILSGEDYDARNELMGRINLIPADRSKIRLGETISAGMAEYDRVKHSSLLNVAEDADKGMYTRKQYLKETLLNKDDRADGEAESDYIPVIHARRHILIVDDVEMNREILGDLLEEDYDITYASDGVEALNELRRHEDNIDLVLLDLRMPNMGGREVIAQMQIDEDLMSIPVIILTVDKDAELYCPHQNNYEQLISRFMTDVFSDKEFAGKFSIRFGVFADARQVENIEERFEFAETAADRVKNDPETNCGFYEQV